MTCVTIATGPFHIHVNARLLVLVTISDWAVFCPLDARSVLHYFNASVLPGAIRHTTQVSEKISRNVDHSLAELCSPDLRKLSLHILYEQGL